jgi:hypothetical protein
MPFILVLFCPLHLDLPSGLSRPEFRIFNFVYVSHSDLSYFLTVCSSTVVTFGDKKNIRLSCETGFFFV